MSTLSPKSGKIMKTTLAMSFLVAIATVAFPGEAHATNWYVTSARNAPYNGTGRSWYSPFSDFVNIDWSQVRRGDHIIVDAGPTSNKAVSYRPLSIPQLPVGTTPLYIEVSNETAHCAGTAVVGIGLSTGQTASIDVGNNSNIVIQGSGWHGVYAPGVVWPKFPNFACRGIMDVGINVGPQARNITIQNMELSGHNKIGMNVAGSDVVCNYVMFHDEPTNLYFTPASSTTLTLNGSWFYGYYKSDKPGLVTSPTAQGTVNVKNSIFGPQLTTAIDIKSPNVVLNDDNTIFINPAITNVKAPQSSQLTFKNVTSYVSAALNSAGSARDCLTFPESDPFPAGAVVSNSVLWGGVVNVQGANSLGGQNFQYLTTGNTLVVSPTQLSSGDQLFVKDPRTLWYPDYDMGMKYDFALKPGSPATGSGSVNVTSVNQYLKSIVPQAAL
ncbi:MAG: hypothetical protein K2X93_21255 [Candidatus Obscuribacterales bacterium]|nr:hypothetical protein [Candidatus Obscuribacterales bacterium]